MLTYPCINYKLAATSFLTIRRAAGDPPLSQFTLVSVAAMDQSQQTVDFDIATKSSTDDAMTIKLTGKGRTTPTSGWLTITLSYQPPMQPPQHVQLPTLEVNYVNDP